MRIVQSSVSELGKRVIWTEKWISPSPTLRKSFISTPDDTLVMRAERKLWGLHGMDQHPRVTIQALFFRPRSSGNETSRRSNFFRKQNHWVKKNDEDSTAAGIDWPLKQQMSFTGFSSFICHFDVLILSFCFGLFFFFKSRVWLLFQVGLCSGRPHTGRDILLYP